MCDPATAVNAYATLYDAGTKVSLGAVTSGACVAVTEEVKKDGMLMLTPSASQKECTQYDNCFRVCFMDPDQGTYAAEFMAEHKIGTKVAVLYESSSDYSKGIYETFMKKAAELGLDVVTEQAFTDQSKTDFSVQLQAIKNSGADVLFMPFYYQEAALVITQAEAAGLDVTYFGVDGMDGIIEQMGEANKEMTEGILLLTPFVASSTDEKIASFTLSGQTAAITDIPDWELGGVELFFDRSETFYIKNTDGHTVEVNGVPLDDSHVIQIATTAAAERLPIGITGVSICTQEISDLMATPTVTIFDESGNPMEVSYDAGTHTFTEQTQANTISDDEREAALNAAKTYCLFMIEKASKADIAKYFDTSSEAYSVITNLSGNLWMQGNNGYRFTKEEVSDYARYSDDLFSARVSLTLNVTRKDGTTKDFGYDSTLFFRKQDTGKWLVYDATNADVNAPVGKVRLTFMNGDTVLSSEFVKTDATELDTPLVSAPEGKVFIGWYRIDKYDNGTTYTMAFDPDENGHVTIPNGTTLEPMTLYALFETPSGTDATEGG